MLGRGETNHIYVDVDGTLLIWPTVPGSPRPGETPRVNKQLVRRLKDYQARYGAQLVIWTMGGTKHAEMARERCGLDGAICIAKPDLAVDDAGDGFKKKLPVVLPADFWR